MNDMQLLEQLAATDRYPETVDLPESLRADVVLRIITRRTEMETIERPDVETVGLRQRRRVGPVLAAAVFVLVLIIAAAGILFANREDAIAPIDSTTTTAAATTTTTAPPIDTAALAAIGERLMTAFDAGDADTVAELVADDADPIDMYGARTKSELLGLFGWSEATGVRYQVQECVGTEPDQVACTVLQSTEWGTASGAPRFEATMFLRVENGQVVAMRFGRPPELGEYYQRFRDFVREADPTAPERMWWASPADEPYPLLTEEATSLFEQYTREYVDSLGGPLP